jgi:hypothetical protein
MGTTSRSLLACKPNQINVIEVLRLADFPVRIASSLAAPRSLKERQSQVFVITVPQNQHLRLTGEVADEA